MERDIKRGSLPIDLGIERLDVGGWRDDPMLHAQDRLDQSGDPRRFERVSDVRLDAGNRSFFPGRKFVGPGYPEGVDFGRTGETRRRGMGLDILERTHLLAISIGTLHGLDLAFLPRRPQAFASTIRTAAESGNDRLNSVTIGQGARQGLQ